MGDPQQEDWMEARKQQVPSFAAQDLSGSDHEENQGAYGKTAPRILHGSTTRFGMVKGSIAARKATAAAASSKARRLPATSATSSSPTWTTTTDNPSTTTGNHQQEQRTNDLKVFSEEGGPFSSGLSLGDGGEQERSHVLGPMGSYYELPKVSSAVDLIRTASHDRSSHSLSQARGLRQASMPTAYANIASTGYYRPSDRIARLYTSTAAALTSSSAHAVAKATAALAVAAGAPAGKGCGSGGRGGHRARNTAAAGGKVVTAPFAAESREILHSLALLQQASSSSSGAPATASSPPLRANEGGGGGGGNQSPSPTGGKESSEAYFSPEKIQRGGEPCPPTSEEDTSKSAKARGIRTSSSATEITGNSEKVGSLGGGTKDTVGASEKVKHRRGGSADLPRPGGAVLISSAQDTRTQLREMRSPPRGMRTLNVSVSSEGRETTTCGVKDFLSWNPVGLDGERKGQLTIADGNHSDGGVGGEGGGGGGGGGGGREAGGGGGSAGTGLADAEKQKTSIARYWEAVDERILHGSPNALGAGAKSPLYDLPPVRD